MCHSKIGNFIKFPGSFASKFNTNIVREHTFFLAEVFKLQEICLSLSLLQGIDPSIATVADHSSGRREEIPVYLMADSHERYYWITRIRWFHDSHLCQRLTCRVVKFSHKDLIVSL